MVGVVSAIGIVGGGLHQYGFTVFFLPVSQDLGLSRAATSLAFSLSRAQGAMRFRWSATWSTALGPGQSSLSRRFFRHWLYFSFLGQHLH